MNRTAQCQPRETGAINVRFLVISGVVVLLVALLIGGLYLTQRAFSPRRALEEMQKALADREYDRALDFYAQAVEKGHRPVSRADHLWIAGIYMAVDPPRYDEAITQFKAVLETDPDDLPVRITLARIYREQQLPEEARGQANEVLSRVEALPEDESEWRPLMLGAEAAWLLAEQSTDDADRVAQLQRAERAVRNAIAAAGPQPSPYRAAIRALRTYGSALGGPALNSFLRQSILRLNEGDRRKLVSAVDGEFRPERAECGEFILYADLCRLLDRWAPAAAAVRALLATPDRTDVACLSGLCLVAAEAGDVALAEDLRGAVAVEDPAVALQLAPSVARAAQIAGDGALADSLLAEAGAGPIDDAAILTDLALLSAESGLSEEAAGFIQRAVDAGADASVATALRAFVALQSDDARAADRLLAETGDLRIAAPWFVFLRAEVASRSGRFAQAERILREGWEAGVEVPNAALVIAELNLRMRRYQLVEEWLDRHDLLAPGDRAAVLIRSRNAIALGKSTIAEKMLRPLAEDEEQPEPAAMSMLGTICRDSDRPDDARDWFEAAVAASDDPEQRARARIELARLARRDGDLAGAAAVLDETLADAPDTAEALDLAAEIAATLDRPSPVEERLAANPADVAALEALAREAFREQDAAAAAAALGEALRHVEAGGETWRRLWSARVPVLAAADRIDEAEGMVAGFPEDLAGDPLKAYARALVATARGDHEASAPMWAEYIAARPGDASSRLVYAGALMRLGRTSEAVDEARIALDAGLSNERAYALLAEALYRDGRLLKAIDAAEAGLEAFPDGVEILTIAADIYQAAGRMDRAIELRQALTQAAPGVHENLLGLAELALLSGDPSAASRWVSEAGDAPRSPRGLFLAALARYRLGEHAEADAIIEEVVSDQANDAQAYTLVGRYYTETGRPDAAIPWFQRSLAERPESVDAGVELGRAFALCDRSDEALALFDGLEEQHPDDVRVRLGRTTVLFSLDRAEEALGDVRTLLEEQGEIKEAHRLESEILASLGRLDEAEQALARSRSLPGDTAAEDYLSARILLQKLALTPSAESRDALNEARDALRVVARRRPDIVELWKLLATISLELRDPRDCLASIERLDGLDGLDEEACGIAVRASVMGGDPVDGALLWRERWAELAPERTGNWLEIGRLRAVLNDREGVGEAVDRLVDLSEAPDEATVQGVATLLMWLDRADDADEWLRESAGSVGADRLALIRARVLLASEDVDGALAAASAAAASADAGPAALFAHALALSAAGRPDEAFDAWSGAVEQAPDDVEIVCTGARLVPPEGLPAVRDAVTRVLDSSPDSIRAGLTLAELDAAIGDWDQAIAHVQSIIDRRADLPEAQYWKARIIARGLAEDASGIGFEDAVDALDRIPRETTVYDSALLLRARLELDQGMLLEASERCRSLLRRRPDSLPALALGVSLLTRRQAFSEAREMINDSARRSRLTATHVGLTGDVALGAARLAARRGDDAEAVRQLEQAEKAYRAVLDAAPDNAPARVKLAETVARQDRLDEAAVMVAPYLDGSPGSAPVLDRWLKLLTELDRFDEAETVAEAWIRAAGEEFGPAHHGLVELLIRAGRAADAVAFGDEFVGRFPDSANALLSAAQAHVFAGDADGAVSLADRAIELAGGDPPAQLLERRAAILFEAGRIEDAAAGLRAALEADPSSVSALNNLAWVLAVSDPPRLEEALDTVRRARELAQDDPDALDTEGMIRHRLGDPNWATELYHRSLERHPDAEVRLRLAQALADAGKKTEARAEAQRVVDGHASAETIDEARKLLYRLGAGDSP